MSIRPTRRPIALCTALLCATTLFAGCSSLGTSSTQAQAAGRDGASQLAEATTATAMVATAPSEATLKAQAAPAKAATLQDEAREAVGAPTDPLRPDTTLNLDDLSANQDLWVRVRRGFGLPELDIALVNDHERWYASRPDYVQRMTERSSRYLFHVLEEIERRQMPTELALLPFIESAFNPQAQSSARASGIWQFMPATGKDFELKQNVFRDDRRDVLASTRAALDYLQRLQRQFGDWHLALAAYNWGEGNVQKAINRNIKAGLPTDYLSLNMPAETRNYVPKLHAVRNIVLRPDSFGLILTPIENHPYFVSVPIQRDMDVTLAAKLAGLSTEAFKDLNPSMNKPVILAAGTPQVLLPYDNASQFVHNLNQHKGLLATWTAWTVPRTMRPAEAAKQVGMSEATLRDINRIPPKMLVKAGSTLLVPRSQHREQDVSEAVADNAMMALSPDLPPLRRMTLRAGKGDSVASLARRYRVSAAQVAQWNKVSPSAKFARGQSVVVYVAGSGKKAQKNTNTRTVAKSSGKAAVKVASASRANNPRVVKVKGRAAPSRASRVRMASAR
ncbi:transglycosylase SLT domain-containing protein [Aquabacterium sp.]|uniref:transglycosylase SLT domain-containing protein n=1 Tax=Aquabacterium sp. TaxID=1872578 RepID=UPI003D6C7541